MSIRKPTTSERTAEIPPGIPVIFDSSVIIDLDKAGILEDALKLPFEFRVPEMMFLRELECLKGRTPDDLLKAGLRVDERDGNDIAIVSRYLSEYRKISLPDSFALVHATGKRCVLLTGDDALRKAAREERIEVHGLLWLVDRMEEEQVLSKDSLLKVLKTWESDPRVRLPTEELRKRIRRLSHRE